MKYRDHIIKLNGHPGALSFLDIGTASLKQSLDIIPLNVSLGRSGENSNERFAVLLSHVDMILINDIAVKLE